jgi:alkylhydroperoxidase/carboxymuconolactone decarboxylase family protein YurZ
MEYDTRMDFDDLEPRDGLSPDVQAAILIQIAAWRGDADRLGALVEGARARGMARALLEEVLLQGVLYYGFPRSISAFDVTAQRWPPASPPRGGALAAREQGAAGRALFAAIYGRNAAQVEAMLGRHHEELRAFVLEVAYGRVLTRPGLPPRTRELIATGLLAAMEQVPQLVAHGRGALHFGATAGEVGAAIATGTGDEARAAPLLRRVLGARE